MKWEMGEGEQPSSPQGHTNLIINYLPQSLTDEEFRSMFLSIGPIKNSKVIRDKQTGYSYGFGFIDYTNPADAARAIESLNGLQLQNKRIKVAYSRPGGEEIKGANLYITNVPRHWKNEQLQEFFSQFGSIVSCRVIIDDRTGFSKGIGFILFDHREDAEKAIDAMNGKIPDGGEMPMLVKRADDNAKKVRPPPVQFLPAPPMAGRYPHGPMRNMGNRFSRYNPMGGSNYSGGPPMGTGGPGGPYILYVYNIGENANEQMLYHMFSAYGNVQKVNVIYDSQRQKCKGYGFVTMTNYVEAENAISCLNGYRLQGRELQVSYKK